MYRIKLLIIPLTILLFSGCVVCNVNIVKIQYLSIRGIELKSWGDNNEVDGRPNDVELFVTLKNQNQLLVNPDKLHIEFWAGKAVKMTIKDQDYVDYDIDKMRSKAKWSLLWKKDISLESFKPGEERKIKIDKIHI